MYTAVCRQQCDPEGPEADDDEDDAMDADSDKEVYGVTTVINLTERRVSHCDVTEGRSGVCDVTGPSGGIVCVALGESV